MNTELQNKAWSVLPKEFREEVKEIYSNAITYHPCGYNHKTDLLEYLFGHHNLTSDAEEEEMLTVRRKEVQEIYKYYCHERDNEPKGSVTRFSLAARISMLEELFDSKCLPDEACNVASNVASNIASSEPKQPKAPTEIAHIILLSDPSFRKI